MSPLEVWLHLPWFSRLAYLAGGTLLALVGWGLVVGLVLVGGME